MKTASLLLALVPLLAQPPQAPPPVKSPEVSADRRVTFRYRAPAATAVTVNRSGGAAAAMTKGADGVWSLTTEALEPDLYGYTYSVDGARTLDPVNPLLVPNFLNPSSAVHVPGPASVTWEVGDVPRGSLHRHFFRSKIANDDRDYYVYTPAGYDAKSRPLPVLYLLHGFSDDASAWTSVGRAHVILDNLIAQGKAKPMLVVMPLGYGTMEIVTAGARDPGLRKRSFDGFRDSLLTEVMPRVEADYRVSKDRKDRAIAGLSMGGAESLFVGLNALDKFASIGAFSAGGLGGNLDESFPKLDASANKQLRLFWMACGTDDRLIESNRQFVAFLKTKKVEHTWIETPGAHTWMVWRRYLSQLTPLLFQPAGAQMSQLLR